MWFWFWPMSLKQTKQPQQKRSGEGQHPQRMLEEREKT